MSTSYCNTNHILVGLGGTGGKILKAFKMRMFEEFPEESERNKQPVALLYVDSTDEMMGIGRPDFRVMGLDASFTQNEFLYIKDVDVAKILDNIDNYPSVKGIVNNVSAVKTAIGSLGQAAGQKRRAGRLLFAANAVAYVNALKNAYGRCDEISHNAEKTNIHIFAGLCGGTGSGSVIDAIVQARKTFPEAIISVYAMIPEMNLPKANMDQGRYYQNGYAALNELNALQAGRFCPHDVTSAGKEAKLFTDKLKGVADGLTLYSNVNENGLTINSLTELPKIVSDYIYARVFLINSTDEINGDMLRAYSFENMDDFALEYDETMNAGTDGRIPVARTKKVNSFGIKRVMYPELRVLKHITYTIGESVLYQFKYNNWRENFGYVNEEANKDYRSEYFNETNLGKWMLDNKHLTYELRILPSDKDYPKFEDYWHDKAIGYADEAKKETNALSALENIMADFYDKSFRSVGVVEYYKGKERAIPDIAKEIRRTIEHELFAKWKIGDISIIELQKVSKLLIERITETRKDLEEKLSQEQELLEAIIEDRDANTQKWVEKGFLTKKVFGGNTNSLAEHQEILTDLFTCKTQIEGWEFAKKLAARLFVEVGRLDADISAFGQKINDAIDETERLVAAQKKVNKGLEDMKGAIIEVSEEETMTEFEADLRIDKIDMPNVARQLRETILPQTEFTNFGNLAQELSIDNICKAFDIKLSSIVRTKHDERADSDKKVLGLNILTQLQQKLTTEEDIQRFALDIVKQSGVYLKLNNDQMQLHVRNNEGNLSPTNAASINKKTILVSIPSPDDNEGLKAFADKLEKAFKNSFAQGNSQCSLVVNKKSPRKDELSIITVAYCFPIRCLSWMSTYKEKYEQFLNTGNPNTDASNAILLHSEGNGKDLPSLFVVDNAEEIAAMKQSAVVTNGVSSQTQSNTTHMPPIGMPMPPVMPTAEPKIQMFFYIGGQNYGPYDYSICKQLIQNNQINEQTMAWQQGMAAWTPAGQVPELRSLFSQMMPPAVDIPMPPMPPTL
ncbi:MAG: GYF domain-containing protein [Bacteroidaceae bacterium]|nr:GYF domain-containing protein [Bacteroidaceae bacterium]